SLRRPDFHRPLTRPTGARPRPRRMGPHIDPGRTPGTAPLLRFLHRGECLDGVLGPTDPDHFFKVRVDSDATLRLALAPPRSVAGLEVIRSPDGQDNGTLDPSDILVAISTLVTDPATLDLKVGADWYLVRVYNFFQDSVDYLLELSLDSPGR